MTAPSQSPFIEVQGLTLCPAQPCPETCSVPPEGEWHGIYHFTNEREAKRALDHVLDSDDPMYDRYEDFRIAYPVERAVKKRGRKAA
jgi:hypothetical protein